MAMTDAEETPQLVDDENADAQFIETMENARGEGRGKVRVRMLLQLYRYGRGQRYKNWRGLIYRLDLEPNLMAAGNFRTALNMFITALTTLGPAKVVDALQSAMRAK